MFFASTLLFGLLTFNLILLSDRIVNAVILVFFLWASSLLYTAVFVSAYGGQNLSISTETVTNGDLRFIQLEPALKYKEEGYRELASVISNLDLIVIDNPGALFLTTNDNFANPWVNYTTWPASFLSIDHSCGLKRTTRLAVILTAQMSSDPIFAEYFNKSLRNCGLNFPSGFQEKSLVSIGVDVGTERLWIEK